MFGRIHISVIFVHPLSIIEVSDMLLQVVHDLVDVFPLGEDRHGVFLVEVILYFKGCVLGPNLDRASFLGSSSPYPLR